ncbi:hypothetical protein [Mycetocola zhadangensis]|uniref:LPXTG cell wall anchor domain-containing protein n=1 Tax=Mycetocola zhadangensis TaxID=1164595 RepID=A0A3L7J1P8_9MICO|nr:hypothetical protein [Mycetocola zhadangensis]RLQ84478.1 hypothetical protein D9V28_09840 [Mycetocola zhadangensis]GGE92660.1 hypothetical protein GCM10011313_14520 [Mycetocola zhadangensis]
MISPVLRTSGHKLGRIGAALAVATVATTLAFAGATAAHAEPEERTLHLTRVDGSPVGNLFTDLVIVPGDTLRTTVVAHRTGPGESSLLITLANPADDSDALPTPIEDDVVITASVNGLELKSSAAALMRGDAVLDLGRSSAANVPIDISLELPFASSNATQEQELDLSVVLTAADLPTSGPDANTPTPVQSPATSANPGGLATILPFLPGTGASVREILIVAALITTFGLILLGGKRKSHQSGNPG